ncbi:unnamed protein product [Amoebophrya sp. A25]|nr:unnamed protein product [Amoebophrya sp. A25]|eukprot:GSA25T00005972001.1
MSFSQRYRRKESGERDGHAANGGASRLYQQQQPSVPSAGPSDKAVHFALRCLGLSVTCRDTQEMKQKWKEALRKMHPDRANILVENDSTGKEPTTNSDHPERTKTETKSHSIYEPRRL